MSSDKGAILQTSLMGIIIAAVVLGSIMALWNTANAGVESIEHKECWSSVAAASGINIEKNVALGQNVGISSPITCPVEVIENFPQEDGEGKKHVGFQTLVRMDTAWWATWQNQIENTFKDYWNNDHVCKQLYELQVDPDKLADVITIQDLETYAGTSAIGIGSNNEQVTFNQRMIITQGKKYFALAIPQGASEGSFKGGDILEIYIYGPQSGGNAVILTNFQGSDVDKLKFIQSIMPDGQECEVLQR
jgi:hypothetical protein